MTWNPIARFGGGPAAIARELVPASWTEDRPANAPRWIPGTRGHVESWFLRANDPARPRALWLKATILAPLEGEPVAEAWFIWFDGETGRTWAHRETRPARDASFEQVGGRTGIRVAGNSYELEASGGAQGSMDARGGAKWALSWARDPSPVGDPLSLYPHAAMVGAPFPKSKLLTPFPSLRFSGSVEVFGERHSLDGWTGMQGHNWGREHAFEYAWGQCLFPADDAMVEGFTGRIRVAGRTSPRLSAMVLRRGRDTWRFDRIFDVWKQDASLDARRWTLRLEGPDAVARLTMDAAERPMVCLGYRNPDGRLSYCLNTKLADVRVQVSPDGAAPFELRSAHGGALEFLRNEPDPALGEVI